jgi:hypothetical protein
LIKYIDREKRLLVIEIPLTKGTEKIRIKKRSFFNEYGIPVPTRSEKLSQSCYVEWQIGYDVVTKDLIKISKTTLKDKNFIAINKKEKSLYELSEYIYYFYKWGIIEKRKLENILIFLKNIQKDKFLDVEDTISIERSHPKGKNILGIDFFYTQVKYPLLVYKFDKYEILTEIIIKEKQYAIGIQPMLYFCFPITELHNSDKLLGRTADLKEKAEFIIDKNNISVFLEMLRIFGILSKNHNYDVINIIDTIIRE